MIPKVASRLRTLNLRWVLFAALVSGAAGGGCATGHQSRVPELLAEVPIAPASVALPPTEVALPGKLPSSNAARVMAQDFFPTGHVERLELQAPPEPIRASPGARFPSSMICFTAAARRALRCETRQSNGGQSHQLMLDDAQTGTTKVIWETYRPFDVIWSSAGDYAAITHWLDEDHSEVLVLVADRGKVYRLPQVHSPRLGALLSPERLRTPWMFRALGWAGYSQLVVRGAGSDAPGAEYGSEFVVDFMKGADSSYPPRLLRAYLRRKS